MKSLQEIYDEIQAATPSRQSDKGWGAYGPQPGGPGHTYAQFYDLLFAKWRTLPIDFLEIGINKGGSLKMWREFFTSAETITGFDIQPSFDPFTPSEMIETHILNAHDEQQVVGAIGDQTFDIIIDDGPHEAESQVAMYHQYKHRVKKGGLYVVEDVQDIAGQWELFNALEPKPTIIDRRWRNGQYDDVLLVFQF